jgi:outer membrane lipoprotein-sorting protein
LERTKIVAAVTGVALTLVLSLAAVPPPAADDLQSVLAEMNAKAAGFKSANADFEWSTYTGLLEQGKKDTQTGRIFFRRGANEVYVAVHQIRPASRQMVYQVAYRDGKLSAFDSKVDQPNEQTINKNKVDPDALMALGFGGRGDDLVKDFDVKMTGWETLDKVRTAKLELAPRDAELKSAFRRINLWIDPARNVALQQQWFFEPSGNYKLAHYTNINLNDDLQSVLAEMNQKAASFKSAKADFEWVTYTKAVDIKDTQTGKVYFQRSGSDVDAAVHVSPPAAKQVVYLNGKVLMYEPKIDQLTEHTVSKNKGDVDALMRLGFGGSGDDLLKNFEVKLGGWEPLDKIRTARLELVPKDPELKAKFSRVDMWMDLSRGVALQQQWFFGASGDYKLAHYTEIKVNSPISEDVFRLKTTKKTVVVHLP